MLLPALWAGVPRACMLALHKRRSCRLAAAFPLCFDGLLQQIDKLWRVDLAPLEGDAALGAFDDCVCLRAAALKGGEKIDESCRVCQQRRPFFEKLLGDRGAQVHPALVKRNLVNSGLFCYGLDTWSLPRPGPLRVLMGKEPSLAALSLGHHH